MVDKISTSTMFTTKTNTAPKPGLFQKTNSRNFSLGLTYSLLSLSLVLIAINLLSNSVLLDFVKKEKGLQKIKTATQTFILAITITSLLGSTTGKNPKTFNNIFYFNCLIFQTYFFLN